MHAKAHLVCPAAAVCDIWHYEEFSRNPLISALSGMCKAISLTLVHTVIHVIFKDDMLIIGVKYSLGNMFSLVIAGLQVLVIEALSLPV